MSETTADPDALPVLYGPATGRRVTVRDLRTAKERGERWAMLTSYDSLTAAPAAGGATISRSGDAVRGASSPDRRSS